MKAQNLCILYVDDDENELMLVKFAAKAAGIAGSLQTVNSGARAIEYLQGQGSFADRDKFPRPHIVLLDLRMPRMNGLEVLSWLRTQRAFFGIAVIILTASAHPDDIKRACQQGANAFIQKPSDQKELVRFLQALRNFWGEFHEFPSGDSSSEPKPELTP